MASSCPREGSVWKSKRISSLKGFQVLEQGSGGATISGSVQETPECGTYHGGVWLELGLDDPGGLFHF